MPQTASIAKRPAAHPRAVSARSGGTRAPLLLGRLAGLREQRKTQRLALCEVRLRDRARQRANTQDVALAFGDADGTASVEHVERVRGLDDEVVGGENQLFERVFVAGEQ